MKIRTADLSTPPPELWDIGDIEAYLGCNTAKATKIMKECKQANGISGYDCLEKHIILDFINQKQREEREREARHKADIAAAEGFAVLKVQVEVLKEQVNILRQLCDSSSEDARKARTVSVVANVISIASVAIAIIALVL